MWQRTLNEGISIDKYTGRELRSRQFGSFGLVTSGRVLSKGTGEVPIDKNTLVYCSAAEPSPGCEDGTVLVSGDGKVSPLFYGVGVIREL